MRKQPQVTLPEQLAPDRADEASCRQAEEPLVYLVACGSLAQATVGARVGAPSFGTWGLATPRSATSVELPVHGGTRTSKTKVQWQSEGRP